MRPSFSFVENIMILGQEYEIDSIRGKDLFFSKHYKFGTKTGKSEDDFKFFLSVNE